MLVENFASRFRANFIITVHNLVITEILTSDFFSSTIVA